MTGRLAGRVALVTGAARGQGRAHAVRLAEEGADVVAVDNCADVPTMSYPGGTPAELEETAELVRGLGRRCIAHQVDVRDLPALTRAVDAAVAELGRLDVVAANAGVSGAVPVEDMTEEQWDETIGINLTGVWKTCKAALPHLVAGGRGGAIVLTGSGAGVKGFPGIAHYSATKSGLLGLMRSLANEVGVHSIRVNTILPTTVSTPMVHNPGLYKKFAPHVAEPTREDFAAVAQAQHVLPVPWVEPEDIAAALAFLVSDEARFITGAALPVDAGILAR